MSEEGWRYKQSPWGVGSSHGASCAAESCQADDNGKLLQRRSWGAPTGMVALIPDAVCAVGRSIDGVLHCKKQRTHRLDRSCVVNTARPPCCTPSGVHSGCRGAPLRWSALKALCLPRDDSRFLQGSGEVDASGRRLDAGSLAVGVRMFRFDEIPDTVMHQQSAAVFVGSMKVVADSYIIRAP